MCPGVPQGRNAALQTLHARVSQMRYQPLAQARRRDFMCSVGYELRLSCVGEAVAGNDGLKLSKRSDEAFVKRSALRLQQRQRRAKRGVVLRDDLKTGHHPAQDEAAAREVLGR